MIGYITIAPGEFLILLGLAAVVFVILLMNRNRFHKADNVGAKLRICPECGAKLKEDGREGLCARCLYRQGLKSSTGGAARTDQPLARTTPQVGEAADPSTTGFHGSVTAPLPEELAPLFHQLEIIELLGQGGMGAVYKARQPALDRVVALKVLPAEVGRDPAFAERFGREARSLAKLNHPNIVGVYDSGHAGELYYFIMEYVDGLNLRKLLRAGQLKPDEALKIVPQICEALQFAHDEGIVHRDIKPENILLDKKGRVKIADFGLAKLLGTNAADLRLTATFQVMGTPHYMAPEQMEKPLEVDHRADIYSLGVVFYEMLTGELPLGRFVPPSEKTGVDQRLDGVVLRALEKELPRRYQHASDVKTDIEAISSKPKSKKPRFEDKAWEEPTPLKRTPSRKQSKAWVWIVLLVGGLLLAGCCIPIVGAGLWVFWRDVPAQRNPIMDEVGPAFREDMKDQESPSTGKTQPPRAATTKKPETAKGEK